jgi:stage II sporulation protein D
VELDLTRPFKPALSLLVACLVATPAAGGRWQAPAPIAPGLVTFVVTGRGWGHGVGLAQYGALGFAKRGVTYDRILAHYYPGTDLGPASVTRVRVLLYEHRPKIKVASESAFRLRDATGVVRKLRPGVVTVSRGPTVITEAGKEKVKGPFTFLRGTTPLMLDGDAYRGALEVAAVGKRLQVINVVGIDAYLYGVITQEMPHDWPAAALQAQAVAARSYALANRFRGDFDLYADVRSQVYGGIAAETASARAAVDATAREVLSHGGKVANTFFFSSSGGRTADVTEVWGTKPIPYLVSVKDPYDAASPYHRWGPVTITAAKAAKALKIPGLQDLVPEAGPSGRARIVFADTVLGRTAVRGTDFRRALELRSTWVSIGRMALDRSAGPVAPGTDVQLTGGIRGLKGVVYEHRLPGGVWQAGAPVRPAANGRFAFTVTPTQTTEYRLRSGLAAGPSLRLVVSA